MSATLAATPTLLSLASGIQHGRIRLSEEQAERIERALADVVACARRDSAVRRLGELLAPGLESRWETAGRIADALDDFEQSRAWIEIRSGSRSPRTTMEAACSIALKCPGPRSQRRILDLLPD